MERDSTSKCTADTFIYVKLFTSSWCSPFHVDVNTLQSETFQVVAHKNKNGGYEPTAAASNLICYVRPMLSKATRNFRGRDVMCITLYICSTMAANGISCPESPETLRCMQICGTVHILYKFIHVKRTFNFGKNISTFCVNPVGVQFVFHFCPEA